jgi:hypothetical protein
VEGIHFVDQDSEASAGQNDIHEVIDRLSAINFWIDFFFDIHDLSRNAKFGHIPSLYRVSNKFLIWTPL